MPKSTRRRLTNPLRFRHTTQEFVDDLSLVLQFANCLSVEGESTKPGRDGPTPCYAEYTGFDL